MKPFYQKIMTLGGCPVSRIFRGSFFGKLFGFIAPEMVPWLSKNSEDQSGGPRTNLEVFGDEVNFTKTCKLISPMPCKTKPRQSSRQCLHMLRPSPRTPPDLPNSNLKCKKNSFCEKLDFSVCLWFVGPIGTVFHKHLLLRLLVTEVLRVGVHLSALQEGCRSLGPCNLQTGIQPPEEWVQKRV